MKTILLFVCIMLSLFYTVAWATSKMNENESSAVASSIYFLCFILLYLFGG